MHDLAKVHSNNLVTTYKSTFTKLFSFAFHHSESVPRNERSSPAGTIVPELSPPDIYLILILVTNPFKFNNNLD